MSVLIFCEKKDGNLKILCYCKSPDNLVYCVERKERKKHSLRRGKDPNENQLMISTSSASSKIGQNLKNLQMNMNIKK